MIKYNLYNLYSNAEYIGMSVISLEIKICHTVLRARLWSK